MISISDIVNHDMLIFMSFMNFHIVTINCTCYTVQHKPKFSEYSKKRSHLAADIVNIFSAHSLVDFHKVKNEINVDEQ